MREENPKPPSDEGFHLRGGKRNPKPPSDEGFHLRGGKQKRKPPSDEGGGPKGRRERFRCIILSALRENGTGLSPPVNFVDSPLVRGGRGVSFQKPASSEGAEAFSTFPKKTSPRRRTSGDGGLCFVGNHHGQISSVSEGFIGFVHVDLDVVQGFHRAPPFPICRGSMLKGLVVFVQQLFDLLNDFHGVSSFSGGAQRLKVP